MTVEITGSAGIADALEMIAREVRAGRVTGISIVWEPTGIGRISYTVIGDELDLPGIECDEDETTTIPGKGQRESD